MLKKNLLLTILFMLAVIACRKEESPDVRDKLSGTYQGMASYEYYYIDAKDTSRTISESNSVSTEVQIEEASCGNCIAVTYDSLSAGNDYPVVSDTISLTETGNFENNFLKIGDTYYRKYSVVFNEDSLHFNFHRAKPDESYRFEFRGAKVY